MPRPTSLRLVAATILGLGLAAGATRAPASVIFSNLGPGDSFDGFNTYFVGGLNSSTGSVFGVGAAQAMAFTVAPGADVTFTEAELALWNTEGSNELTVQLATDLGGLPGTILESIQVTVPGSATLVSALSTALPVLTAGSTYWIIATTDLLGNSDFGWFFTDPPASSLIAFQTDDGFGPSGWSSFTDTGAAFRVSGVSLAAVPEPSALVLAGLGLPAALVFLRRRARAVAA